METLTKVVKIINARKCMWFTAGILYRGSVTLTKSASFSIKKICKRNLKRKRITNTEETSPRRNLVKTKIKIVFRGHQKMTIQNRNQLIFYGKPIHIRWHVAGAVAEQILTAVLSRSKSISAVKIRSRTIQINQRKCYQK